MRGPERVRLAGAALRPSPRRDRAGVRVQALESPAGGGTTSLRGLRTRVRGVLSGSWLLLDPGCARRLRRVRTARSRRDGRCRPPRLPQRSDRRASVRRAPGGSERSPHPSPAARHPQRARPALSPDQTISDSLCAQNRHQHLGDRLPAFANGSCPSPILRSREISPHS